MIEIKAKMRDKSGEWEEYFDVISRETAEQEIKEVLESFNSTLRPGESPREFLGLVDEKEIERNYHDWYRTTPFSLEDEGGTYDLYVCKGCGLERKCYGYHKPGKGECHLDRVCKPCNKEFKSTKNLERHNRRFHGNK